MGKMVILRFLIKESPHYMQVALPDKEARGIIEGWIQGRHLTFIGDSCGEGGGWAIKADQIAGMHMMHVEEQPKQQTLPPRQGYPFGHNLSGR